MALPVDDPALSSCRLHGQALVNDILEGGRRFYRPEEAYIPVEFKGAAYRFGHSMVRPRTERIWQVTRPGILRDDL